MHWTNERNKSSDDRRWSNRFWTNQNAAIFVRMNSTRTTKGWEITITKQDAIVGRLMTDATLMNRLLPVIFHSMKGDHWHLIIKQAYEINKDIGNKWIDAIPKSFWKVYDLINWWSQIPGLLRTHGVITCEACRTHLRSERQFQELYCYIINISRTHWTAMKNKLLPVRLATWHQEVGPHKTATNK